MPAFDPFRCFRLRSTPLPPPPPPSEEGSDESLPDHDTPRVIHVLAPSRNDRKPGERPVSIAGDQKFSPGALEKTMESTHIALPLDKAPHAGHPDRPSKIPSKSGIPSNSADALQPPTKTTLIRRVTSKLHIIIPSKSQGLRSRPSSRTLPVQMCPPAQASYPSRPTLAASPTLPSAFVSREHREAALRERGLRPPRKDLSEQEREADERLGNLAPPRSMTYNGQSEAERFKTSWLATNGTSEGSDPDCDLPAPPHLQATGTDPRSVLPSLSSSAPPDADISRRSGEGKMDLFPAARPSICSSAPALSASSHLEVLHEEPSEQGPVTPLSPLSPVNVPVIVSTPVDSPLSPIFAESLVSCTFSSRYPGSTVDSQSQSDHSRAMEKESISSSRRRTTDSGHRPRKALGSSLGTRSLSNLRRSVAGSLRLPSSSTLSSADHSASSIIQAPRAAISPTMHSIGSIIRETRYIADDESRRLSELAFLD